MVKVTKAHDGTKLFHHRTEFTPIEAENMASVILKITSSTKEREVQFHLPIVDNAGMAHMPKVISTYVIGTTYRLANFPKQRKLHSKLASLRGFLKDL